MPFIFFLNFDFRYNMSAFYLFSSPFGFFESFIFLGGDSARDGQFPTRPLFPTGAPPCTLPGSSPPVKTLTTDTNTD